ncbi:MAG: FAD-dependent oxidoreductase [Chlamydiota bacterium]
MVKTVAIVGGGLAGMSAAYAFNHRKYRTLIFEKNHYLGGRVQTEFIDGYTLDVGYQVLLSSYPEISLKWQRALKLRSYESGAHVKIDDQWRLVPNPLMNPLSMFKAPKGNLKGLISLVLNRQKVQSPNETTEEYIKRLNIDSDWIDQFIKPFMRGVFLEKGLETRADRFIELMNYFIKGHACLPRGGMKEIPRWLENQIPNTQLYKGTKVVECNEGSVMLSCGKKYTADAVIIALPLPELKLVVDEIPEVHSCSTSCDYFCVEKKRVKADRYLWLDGQPDAVVNNFSFPSRIQRSYAPRGMHLLSATAITPNIPSYDEVREYLAEQFDLKLNWLSFIKRFHVSHALPSQINTPPMKSIRHKGVFLAGEAVSSPSINDAVASGKAAAKAVIESLG